MGHVRTLVLSLSLFLVIVKTAWCLVTFGHYRFVVIMRFNYTGNTSQLLRGVLIKEDWALTTATGGLMVKPFLTVTDPKTKPRVYAARNRRAWERQKRFIKKIVLYDEKNPRYYELSAVQMSSNFYMSRGLRLAKIPDVPTFSKECITARETGHPIRTAKHFNYMFEYTAVQSTIYGKVKCVHLFTMRYLKINQGYPRFKKEPIICFARRGRDFPNFRPLRQGTPLICGKYVIGIKQEQDILTLPDVFTRLESFWSWIAETTSLKKAFAAGPPSMEDMIAVEFGRHVVTESKVGLE